jgi:hypothetical protein
MPLLDHFHPPLSVERSWESLHSAWATALADDLNRSLPDQYFAEEHTHAGGRVEIDVAAMDGSTLTAIPAPNSGTAVSVSPHVWTPPAPALVLPAHFPEDFEVLVFSTREGPTLVAAIELVSPRNKDRPDSRRAFGSKCANYLYRGVSLIIVDIVTERRANLHNETMDVMKADERFFLSADPALYAVAYRPIIRDAREEIDLWPNPLDLGAPLPVLPLAINAELVLPVNFERTYVDVCQRRRLR